MSETDYIYAKDLPLYIDVYCYQCGKLCALSNTVEVDGRHSCRLCAGEFVRGAAVVEFAIDFEPEVIRL